MHRRRDKQTAATQRSLVERNQRCANCTLLGLCEWELHGLKRWNLYEAGKSMRSAERIEPQRHLHKQLGVCTTQAPLRPSKSSKILQFLSRFLLKLDWTWLVLDTWLILDHQEKVNNLTKLTKFCVWSRKRKLKQGSVGISHITQKCCLVPNNSEKSRIVYEG